jgi:hypothetical protein
MQDSILWQPLLRESLAVLALPAEEQIRVNGPGPGCIACDLLNDFDHARLVAIGIAQLSEGQRRLLDEIDHVMRTMEKPDFECFNDEVVKLPVWRQLRELAVEALQIFGWEATVVHPFVEVRPGVWQRPRGDS